MSNEPMRPNREVFGGILEPPSRYRLPLLFILTGAILLLALVLVLLVGWWIAQRQAPLSLTQWQVNAGPGPRIAVDPPSGQPGTLLRVTGQNWMAGDVVFVSLEAPFAESSHDFAFGGAVADAAGVFTVNFAYPNADPWASAGVIKVVAWAEKSGAKAVTIFQTLSPTPTSGSLTKPTPQAVVPPGEEHPVEALAVSTRVPPPAEHWYGQYYAGIDLGPSPVFVRDDPEIRFDWGDAAPGVRLSNDGFSARWTRQVSFGAGVYRFFATADDGIRIWVDDSLVVDQWHESAPTTYVGDRYLWQGQHEVRVEYYERADKASIHVWWERQDVYPEWKGEYFNGRMPDSNPDAVRNDSQIRFNWTTAPPVPGFKADDFSARWTRRVRLPGGMYRFYIRADDGIRVWLDSSLVIDLWKSPGTGLRTNDLTLTDGDYSVRVEYFNHGAEGRVELRWERLQATPKAGPPVEMAALPPSAGVPEEITIEPISAGPAPAALVEAQAVAAGPVPGEATLRVQPEIAQPGSVVAVQGAGWPAGSEVSVLLAEVGARLPAGTDGDSRQAVTAATVAEDGSFEAAFVFDPGVRATSGDQVQLVAYTPGWSIWRTQQVWLPAQKPPVQPARLPAASAPGNPTLEVTPPDVTPGSSFTVSGTGWRPNDQVVVALVKPGEDLLAAPAFAQGPVDERGDFSLALTLPTDPRWSQFPDLILVAHSIDWTTRLVSPLHILTP